MERGLVWTEKIWTLKKKMMDLFLTNTDFHYNWSCVDYLCIIVFLSAVWTLILMAPIHCRGSTGEQVIDNARFLHIFSDE